MGIGAGASGVLTVANQGANNGMVINLGRSGGVGVLNLDNGVLKLAGQQAGNSLAGARIAVGLGGGSGMGTLRMSASHIDTHANGAVVLARNGGVTVTAHRSKSAPRALRAAMARWWAMS